MNIISRSVNFPLSRMLNRFNHLTADDRIIGTLRLQIEVVQSGEEGEEESVEHYLGGEAHLNYLTNQIHLKFKCKNCPIFSSSESNMTTERKIILLRWNVFRSYFDSADCE